VSDGPTTLWKIISIDTLKTRAARVRGKLSLENASAEEVLDLAAKRILDAEASGSAEELFREFARAWISKHPVTERRQRAGRLAVAFGADPRALIAYLKARSVM